MAVSVIPAHGPDIQGVRRDASGRNGPLKEVCIMFFSMSIESGIIREYELQKTIGYGEFLTDNWISRFPGRIAKVRILERVHGIGCDMGCRKGGG